MIQNLEWISESEIKSERLVTSENETIGFDELAMVSVYDFKKRLLCEDLQAINDQRTIENQLLDNFSCLQDMMRAEIINLNESKDARLTISD